MSGTVNIHKMYNWYLKRKLENPRIRIYNALHHHSNPKEQIMTTLVIQQTVVFNLLSKVNAFLNQVVENSAKARAAREAGKQSRSLDIMNLINLANRYENEQPNLAAELRALAARD